MKRIEYCKICLDGASNLTRVVSCLKEAIEEVQSEGGDPMTDPYVHGILTQVTNLLGCGSFLNHSIVPDLFEKAYRGCFLGDC